MNWTKLSFVSLENVLKKLKKVFLLDKIGLFEYKISVPLDTL